MSSAASASCSLASAASRRAAPNCCGFTARRALPRNGWCRGCAQLLVETDRLDVRIAADTTYSRFVDDDFDADIVYGEPTSHFHGASGQQGVVVLPLGTEVVTPLCAPELASRIRSARCLLSETLIESEQKKVRWPAWFAANGLGAPEPRGPRFDRSFLSLSAAADGLGVALEFDASGRTRAYVRAIGPSPGRDLRRSNLHRALAGLPACETVLPIDHHLRRLAGEGAGVGRGFVSVVLIDEPPARPVGACNRPIADAPLECFSSSSPAGSGLSVFVKSFGCRLASESPRGTNPRCAAEAYGDLRSWLCQG